MEYGRTEVFVEIDGQRYPVLDCSSWGVRFCCEGFQVGDWYYATVYAGDSGVVQAVIEVVDVDRSLCTCLFKGISGTDKESLKRLESGVSYFSVLTWRQELRVPK